MATPAPIHDAAVRRGAAPTMGGREPLRMRRRQRAGAKRLRHRLPLAIAVALACSLVGAQLAAAQSTSGKPLVVVRKSVNATLSASGVEDATNTRLFTQIVVTGNGAYTIADPTSTDKLRNLDGFSKPTTQGGKAIWHVTTNGHTELRSVAQYTLPLPVQVRIAYRLDGKELTPSQLLGKSGNLTASYTFANVTGTPTQIHFKDGYGHVVTRTVSLVTPYVGQFRTTLPGTWTNLVAPHADVAGDGHGNNLLTWTLVLFSPIGKPTINFHYAVTVHDLSAIPPGSLQFVPVPPANHPEIDTGQVGYAAGQTAGETLTSGGEQMNSGVVKLQSGTGQLLSGLTLLDNGANQLSSGLGSKAVPGAAALALGLRRVDGGLTELADPVTGLPSALPGIARLEHGVKELKAGVGGPNEPNTLIWGLTQLINPRHGLPAAVTGLAQLKEVVDGFVSNHGVVHGVVPTIQGIAIGGQGTGFPSALHSVLKAAHSLHLTDKQGNLISCPTAPSNLRPVCENLHAVIEDQYAISSNASLITQAVQVGAPAENLPSMDSGLDQLSTGTKKAIAGIHKLLTGAGEISNGLESGNDAKPGVYEGLALLAAGIAKAVGGVDQLQAGVNNQAVPGAQELANGLVPAATGSSQIAGGLGKARAGDKLIHNGVGTLHKKGTSKLISQGNATTVQYGEEYATMLALDSKATAKGVPYGLPSGAIGTAAFQYTIEGVSPSAKNNMILAILAIVLIAVAVVVATLLRRRTHRPA